MLSQMQKFSIFLFFPLAFWYSWEDSQGFETVKKCFWFFKKTLQRDPLSASLSSTHCYNDVQEIKFYSLLLEDKNYLLKTEIEKHIQIIFKARSYTGQQRLNPFKSYC